MPEELLSVEEVADYLQIHRSTVYRLVKDGRIPAVWAGYHWQFKRQEINDWTLELAIGNAKLLPPLDGDGDRPHLGRGKRLRERSNGLKRAKASP